MDPNKTPSSSASDGIMPEKYIRTFASDMDIFKKGGTPGLAPLKRVATPDRAETESADVPVRQPLPIPEVVSAPPPPMTIQKPYSISESEPGSEVQFEPQEPAERLIEASPVIEEPIVVSSVSEPESVLIQATEPAPLLPPEEFEKSAPLETYSEDFRKRMTDTNASTATVLAEEQDAARTSQAAFEPRQRDHAIFYVIAGLILVGASGVGIYLAYSRYQVASAPVIVTPVSSTPIFVDGQSQVSGTGAALAQAIARAASVPIALNTAIQLLPDPSAAYSNIFLALAIPAPGILLRNLNQRSGMAGVVSTINGQTPFFILSVDSYSATFSGMLNWEPTMQRDLATLFSLYSTSAPIPEPVIATTTALTTKTKAVTKTSTTTPSAPVVTPIPAVGFHDEVVSNHDVRVYLDAQGNSILVYGYWNQATLIIARDPIAFAEILVRLATSHS